MELISTIQILRHGQVSGFLLICGIQDLETMICNCAACGNQMESTQYGVITPIGLVNNLCSDECIKIYCNEVDIDQEIKEVKTNDLR